MHDPMEIVKIARNIKRPSALDYIDYIFTDFFELKGDRLYRDDSAIVGGIAMLSGIPVTVIGIQKGKTVEENVQRNFGSPHPEGYRKALRLMKQAEKFKRPVICFVNTSGAFCGIGAEERGQGEAIARNLFELSNLKTPMISIITGEGGSGGALALAVVDEVWMLENSVYSILSPEGFAAILWKDAKRAEEAAKIMGLTSKELFDMGIIEKIIPEAEGGAHNDTEKTASILKEELIKKINELLKTDTEALIEKRYLRFRRFGEDTYTN